MAKLSRDQIAMYARSAGLSGGAVDIAVAVALAESGGDPGQRNPIPPDNSYGLWQINMLGGMGPERRRKFGLSSNSELYDPATNARAMAAISNGGTNWSPWSTYTDGKYRKYLKPGATQAGDGLIPGIPDPGDALDGAMEVAKGVNAMAELSVGAAEWLSDSQNWIRIAQGLVGGALILVGLQVMTSGAVLKVAKQAGNLIPAGKAAKVATAAKAAS